MNQAVVFIVIVLIMVFAIIAVQYYHKRHREYQMEDIEKAVRGAYPKGVCSIEKHELVEAVKRHFHCSSKEALYLIGVARRKRIVDIAADYVTLL